MINKREIRISIFYFTLIIALIFTLWIIKISGFVHKGSGNMFNLLIVLLMAFLLLAPFCLIAVIYHIVKAFRFSRKVKVKKQNIILEYDNRLWRSLILLYFRLNIIDDFNSLCKFFTHLFPVSLIGISIIAFIRMEHFWAYFSIPLVIFLVYFLWIMGRHVLKSLDHLFFSERKVILMTNGAILNGEFINWDLPGESKLIEMSIEDKYIIIKYCVRARANWNFENNKDIRRLKIPIPTEKYELAKSFVSKN